MGLRVVDCCQTTRRRLMAPSKVVGIDSEGDLKSGMNPRESPPSPALPAKIFAQGDDLVAAATLLHGAFVDPSHMSDHIEFIRSLEEASNVSIGEVARSLDSTDCPGAIPAVVITILLQSLDGAMDALEEAADFVQVYGIRQPTDQATGLASFLRRAAEELLECITGAREHRDVSSHVRVVARIEDEADELYRTALGALVVLGSDPFHAMCWRRTSTPGWRRRSIAARRWRSIWEA